MMQIRHNILITYLFVISFLTISCSGGSDEAPPKPGGGGDENPPVEIEITDQELLDITQKETFKYFWNYAEENSGAARERYVVANPDLDKNIVTTGGTGFGLMSIIAAIERGFITREEGFQRISKIIDFFETADRFHGVWPHWLDGRTGKVKPFSTKDNGGDLVETAFFAQGLLIVRNYFQDGTIQQKTLSEKADELWREIEWDWYTNGQNVLYWHWSPDYNWDIGLKVTGFNECLIAYVLAASSPTHPISKQVYIEGWARSGGIKSASVKYGYPLVVQHAGGLEYGGPLFWSHYSFLGLNPKGLSDEYVNYGDVVTNHAKINFEYCVQNPIGYRGYSKDCWGLTASYSKASDGGLTYAAHSPSEDLGVISPTAAISSMPYTPDESLDALRYFYSLKDRLLGPAGFYDAFSLHPGIWVAEAYLAIDQGPIVVMVENYRTGLLWSLFMGDSEIKNGLDKLGFNIGGN